MDDNSFDKIFLDTILCACRKESFPRNACAMLDSNRYSPDPLSAMLPMRVLLIILIIQDRSPCPGAYPPKRFSRGAVPASNLASPVHFYS